MYIVFLAAFITLFLQVDLCVDEGAVIYIVFATQMKHLASKMVADSHSKTGVHNRCVYIIINISGVTHSTDNDAVSQTQRLPQDSKLLCYLICELPV